MVVSAPTGSGKTKIFELAILELLLDLERTGGGVKDVKIIYSEYIFTLNVLHQTKDIVILCQFSCSNKGAVQ